MSAPWNDWYHCMGNTYGTWLPGDPRGFRTRHHREHIPFDYKHPPPAGHYAKRYAKAKSLMKRPPVHLTQKQRRRAVEEFVRSLRKRGIEVLVLSIDRIHFHVLARFTDRKPRHHLGVAKKESSHYLKSTDDAPEGGLWAGSTECIPVTGRDHQLNAFGYIVSHRRKGAVVWVDPRITLLYR